MNKNKAKTNNAPNADNTIVTVHETEKKKIVDLHIVIWIFVYVLKLEQRSSAVRSRAAPSPIFPEM